jgi:hypothetical protein
MPHKDAVPLHKVCGDGFNSKVGGFASIIIDDNKYDAQEVAHAVIVSKADAERLARVDEIARTLSAMGRLFLLEIKGSVVKL